MQKQRKHDLLSNIQVKPWCTEKKGLSDTRCNVKFSFCYISKYKAIWKENLVVNQTSLRPFFHAPLQLKLF